MNFNWSNLLDMRNLQEQVKEAFCYQKIFWPLTVWSLLISSLVLVISKFLQILGLLPRISKVFFWSLEQFFLTVGQNNFGNKIPLFQKIIQQLPRKRPKLPYPWRFDKKMWKTMCPGLENGYKTIQWRWWPIKKRK